jgi:hypothetical protein
MARDHNITDSDLRDGRQVMEKFNMTGPEMMRHVRRNMEGASHSEIQERCEKIFLDKNRDK